MKVPFLSISNTVTLKYSHERKRHGPKYTSRDRLKYILNAKIKRGFTTREQVCVRNYFRVELRCSGIRPIARTGVINYDPFIRSKLPRYRLFRNDKRARNWDVASRESGSTDNIEIDRDGDDATEQITYRVICIRLRSISGRERASTAN